MKRIFPVLLAFLLFAGCGENKGSYQQITQEEAKEMMDTQEVIVLGVREQDEYDSGHIPGAVLLPEIQAFFESEEEQREYAEWKSLQEAEQQKQA